MKMRLSASILSRRLVAADAGGHVKLGLLNLVDADVVVLDEVVVAGDGAFGVRRFLAGISSPGENSQRRAFCPHDELPGLAAACGADFLDDAKTALVKAGLVSGTPR